MINNKAYLYAKKCTGRNSYTPKYVKKQCRLFNKIWEGKDKNYCIDEKVVSQIEGILKLLIMPKGLKAGQTLYECSTGYQWLFYIAILCTVHRDDHERRRYHTGLLEIGRKNFKSYTVATIFILLMILEPRFSKFYSVAPDGSLSREVKQAIEETLKASPLIYKYQDAERFKILRDSITFTLKENAYFPLNYTTSRFDGKLPTAFCADEVGALPNNYAIEAMRSGQLNIKNRLGCIISTKYPTINNPFEDEVEYAKRVLDGIEKDDTVFALLFEPDDTKNWMNNDNVLKHANPVALDIPEIWDDLLKRRAKAIAMESVRENFLTKHCNIIYQGAGTETYIDVNYVQKCRSTHVDFTGMNVYVGVDLAITTDNCSVAITAVDDNDNILIDSYAFIPEGRIEEKNRFEKIDYNEFIKTGKCIACGNMTIDYKVIEDFVIGIEERFSCTIMAIGFDRSNALSSAQKWEEAGLNTVQVRQHSDTLHTATKLLEEKILNEQVRYEKNKLLEINFQNARVTYDTTMRKYVHKKKSKGKIDMVMAILDAVFLLEKDHFLGSGDFFVQY